MKSVTVYTKNNCPQCQMTKMVLDGEGVKYTVVNIEDDTDEGKKGYDFVVNELELRSLPVVVVDGEEPFTGFQPEKLKELK